MISFYSIWLPFLSGAIIFRKLENSIRIFFSMISLGVIFEVLGRLFNKNNLILLNFWDSIEFTLLLLMFSKWTYFKKYSRYFLIAIASNLIVRIILYYLGFESVEIIKSYASILSELIIILFGMYTIYRLSKESKILIYQESKFYLLVGILLFYSGTSFVSLISLIVSPEDILPFWYIHGAANIIANILYTGCFLLQYKNSKLEPSF